MFGEYQRNNPVVYVRIPERIEQEEVERARLSSHPESRLDWLVRGGILGLQELNEEGPHQRIFLVERDVAKRHYPFGQILGWDSSDAVVRWDVFGYGRTG